MQAIGEGGFSFVLERLRITRAAVVQALEIQGFPDGLPLPVSSLQHPPPVRYSDPPGLDRHRSRAPFFKAVGDARKTATNTRFPPWLAVSLVEFRGVVPEGQSLLPAAAARSAMCWPRGHKRAWCPGKRQQHNQCCEPSRRMVTATAS